LIEEYALVEIVSQTTGVNWFCSMDQKIYQTINSSLPVTKNSIYFSGAFEPQREPVFVSKHIPISCIDPMGKPASITLNLSLLGTDFAKALITEIKNWDRQDSLETLDSALDELNSASIIANGEKTELLAHELGVEVKLLMQETNRLELTIQKKCELLCKRVLSEAIGDQIVTQIGYQNKNQEIRIESVRYYDRVLYLDGPKILKNRALGKRTEPALITLIQKMNINNIIRSLRHSLKFHPISVYCSGAQPSISANKEFFNEILPTLKLLLKAFKLSGFVGNLSRWGELTLFS
jgi:hypothetical protein